MKATEHAIRGSCLCQAVRFEVRGPFGRASHCHCSMCRKAHGAPFGTYARVKRSDFYFLAGESEIAAFASSPGISRTFCRRCGSTLQFLSNRFPDAIDIALGTLDDDPGIRPVMHIFTGSRAPWYEIGDGLPQHEAWP
jgi:hypothetical protein